MVRIAAFTTVAFAAWAVMGKDIIDHSGDANSGNGNGQQFINGKCEANADCKTGCCAKFIDNNVALGVCSGDQADFLNTKCGCGTFGDNAVLQPQAPPECKIQKQGGGRAAREFSA
ncbi:hypothetical protein CDD83_56 [Cordyceps sp. RAO-2017]|nr:hypothetical protein CDD83_56 [Cordyceps sp. RAO-2017]